MRSKYLILGIIILLCAQSAHSATYTIDPRKYVDWSKCEYPYNQLVKLRADSSLCTAQFVAPDIVATAMHCIADTKTGKLANIIKLQNCNGDWFRATIVDHADIQDFLNDEQRSRYDWALLRVDDPQHYNQAHFNIDDEQTTPQPIELIDVLRSVTIKETQPGFIGTSAGWGALPILSDEEIIRIKSELKEKVSQANNGLQYNVDDGVSSLYVNGYFDGLVSEDSNKLKIHQNCKLFPNYNIYGSLREHASTCMIWAGNSGGAFFTESDNTLHGVASMSVYMLPNQNIHDNKSLVANYAPTRQIYQSTDRYSDPQPQPQEQPQEPQQQTTPQPQPQEQPQEPQQQTIPQPQPQEQPQESQQQTPPQSQPQEQPQEPQQQTIPQPQPQEQPQKPQQQTTPQSQPQEQPQETPDISEEDINTLGNNINNGLQNIDNMSDYDFLILLGNIIDYNQLRKEYERAKAREQSTANKILGAAAIGATGIGGMQLMSGLAEQNADAAAERDMQAYLATFRCDYGQGRNILGGQTNIQLPGAGDLIQYTTEYKQLAADLKANKEALGMLPGIESETVFDSAATGLYNNVGVGIQSGAFTSLSRALMDENGADAAAWAEQKEKAKNKTKTGAAIAGTGAVGGAVGNLIINRDQDNDKKSADTTGDASTVQ